MDTSVRIKIIEVENLKNIKHGNIRTNSEFDAMDSADIIGIYGQNGSGKTAIVEALSLLKKLINEDILPENNKYLVSDGQKTIKLHFEFLIKNPFGEFTVNYECSLSQNDSNLTVTTEKLFYKENLPYYKNKPLLVKEKDSIKINKNSLEDSTEQNRVQIMLANQVSLQNNTSFIFSKNLDKVLENQLDKNEFELIKNLKVCFNTSFYIIEDTQTGLVLSNIIMPFHISAKNIKQNLYFTLKESIVVSQTIYPLINTAINQINIVLKTLIPNLQVLVKKLSEETNKDGKTDVRFEFLSKKNDTTLPLRCESAGVLKLISILSSLIAVNNNPKACVVIDELDSGIFEYLLGEILQSIDKNGKGQFFFTSHNLRVLEVLDSKKMWFSTINSENRFVQLKNVKKLSNVRDMYLRAVQLGGQKEVLYDDTDDYDVKKSFAKAGLIND